MTRALGIDPGAVRCGVALTNSERTMAFPRSALRRDDALIENVRALVTEEHVAVVVVGRPVSLAGHDTASTADADALFRALAVALPDVAVVQCDERLTTVQAQRSLSDAGRKAKEHRDRVDSAAAVVMLQHYVDGQRA